MRAGPTLSDGQLPRASGHGSLVSPRPCCMATPGCQLLAGDGWVPEVWHMGTYEHRFPRPRSHSPKSYSYSLF